VDAAPDVLNSLVNWQTNAQFWLLNRLQLVQLNQLGTRDQVEEELYCLGVILAKMEQIYRKNSKFLGACVSQCSSMLNICKWLFYRILFEIILELMGVCSCGFQEFTLDVNLSKNYWVVN
jgi:hypothetical protein